MNGTYTPLVGWFGDDTAWRLGRVSLNPLKHVDPFGTIVLHIAPETAIGVRQPFMFPYQVLGCFLTGVGCKVVAKPMQSG